MVGPKLIKAKVSKTFVMNTGDEISKYIANNPLNVGDIAFYPRELIIEGTEEEIIQSQKDIDDMSLFAYLGDGKGWVALRKKNCVSYNVFDYAMDKGKIEDKLCGHEIFLELKDYPDEDDRVASAKYWSIERLFQNPVKEVKNPIYSKMANYGRF